MEVNNMTHGDFHHGSSIKYGMLCLNEHQRADAKSVSFFSTRCGKGFTFFDKIRKMFHDAKIV